MLGKVLSSAWAPPADSTLRSWVSSENHSRSAQSRPGNPSPPCRRSENVRNNYCDVYLICRAQSLLGGSILLTSDKFNNEIKACVCHFQTLKFCLIFESLVRENKSLRQQRATQSNSNERKLKKNQVTTELRKHSTEATFTFNISKSYNCITYENF